MSLGRKLFWGGLGWVVGGPIGAILGYAFASISDGEKQGRRPTYRQRRTIPRTSSGDFMVSLLVLFASVMKADDKLLRSELDYVKQFLRKQFREPEVQHYLQLFKGILKQQYSLRPVCLQIQRSMDHPSRLELMHMLFGLSNADRHIHKKELKVIELIAGYLNVNQKDFASIKAMFIKDTKSSYRILEIEPTASDAEVKSAYRKMAKKYHPDKVGHLGKELQKAAEEKFKAVNKAYQDIKRERSTA